MGAIGLQGWDQQVFNEEAFFLSHGEVKRANVDGMTVSALGRSFLVGQSYIRT
jgi:hypothetical protein